MAQVNFKQVIKRPFNSPWVFFVITIVLFTLMAYHLHLYSAAHWGVIAKSNLGTSSLRALFNEELKDKFTEQDINELIASCKVKSLAEIEDLDKFKAKLDEQSQKEINLLCNSFYWVQSMEETGFSLLGVTGSYRLFGLLTLISSVICLTISIIRKKLWVGLIALLLGLYGYYTSSIIM